MAIRPSVRFFRILRPALNRQPCCQHLVAQLSGAGRIERIAEQRLDLGVLGVKLLDQILDAVAMAREGWLQIIQLPRQHGFHQLRRNGFLAGQVAGFQGQAEVQLDL